MLPTAAIDSSCSLPTPTASPYAGSSQNGSNSTRPSAGTPSLMTMAREGLLPTPTSKDVDASGSASYPARTSDRTRHSGVTLTDAMVRLLPTPRAADARRSSDPSGEKMEGGPSLTGALLPTPMTLNRKLHVASEMLPTPTAADAGRASDQYARGNLTLTGASSMLPTPSSRDCRSGGASEETMQRNARPLNETVANGNPKRRLNPEFVERMQDLPPGWTNIRGSLERLRPSSGPAASSPAASSATETSPVERTPTTSDTPSTSSSSTGPSASSPWATPLFAGRPPRRGPSSGLASSGELLRPFWRYFGAKWRSAPRYPQPEHDTIVEPFAGAAGYALRYPDRKVILIEKYAPIAKIWKYLITAPSEEILAVPTVDYIDDLPDWVPEGARLLVGFCFGAGQTTTRRQLSAGLRKFRALGKDAYGWSEAHRARVARQVDFIRHWEVIEGDYSSAPDVDATWFIDPPYQEAGKYYKCSSAKIDFAELGAWCQARSGQVIVCEAEGANWLPFRTFAPPEKTAMNRAAARTEVIWTGNGIGAGAAPIVKWVGGKSKALPALLERLPTDYLRYFEPFAGGAALFFKLAPRAAVLGDSNPDLIAMYRTLAADVEAVIRRLKLHKQHHEVAYYYDVRERWNDPSVSWSAVDRAAAFIYLNKTCFNGLWRVNRAGEFNVPIGSYKNPTICQPDALRAAARVLARADLRCGDFAAACQEAGERDLVYFDSPYDAGGGDRDFTAYTAGGFGPADQRRLAELARDLVARGCHVVLSNRDTPLVRELYDGLRIDRVEVAHTISADGDQRGAVGEVIILNELVIRGAA